MAVTSLQERKVEARRATAAHVWRLLSSIIAIAASLLSVACDSVPPAAPDSAWSVRGTGKGHGIIVGDTAFVILESHELVAYVLPSTRPLWRRSTGSGALGAFFWGSNVVAAGEVVALVDDDQVVAFRRRDGVSTWTYRPSPAGSSIGFSLAADSTHILVEGRGSNAVLLSAATGEIVWRAQPTMEFSTAAVYSATIDQGQIFVCAEGVSPRDGWVAAFDRRTGIQQWAHRLVGDSPGQNARCWNRPAVLGERVIIAPETGRVIAYDRRTGRELWRTTPLVPLQGPQGDLMLVLQTDGGVTVSSGYRMLVALDTATGRERWRRDLTNGPTILPVGASLGDQSAHVAFGDLIFAQTRDGATRVLTGIGARGVFADVRKRRYLVTTQHGHFIATP
jgi:outer membrane protein assembly factor BamB